MPSNHLSPSSPPALDLSQHKRFPMSQLFPSGGQGIRVLASASVLPMIFRLTSFRINWLDLLAVEGTLKSLFQPHKSKSSSSSVHSVLYGPTLTPIHDYWKNHSFDYMDLVGKVMSLLFNILSRFVIAALPKTKHLLIS